MASSEALPMLLNQLRLSTMARLWENFLTRTEEENWSPAQYLAALCEQELNERHSRRIERFTKDARLPIGKTLATFDFSQTPTVRPERIECRLSLSHPNKMSQSFAKIRPFFRKFENGPYTFFSGICEVQKRAKKQMVTC
jgi:DNA replication protein DnaC